MKSWTFHAFYACLYVSVYASNNSERESPATKDYCRLVCNGYTNLCMPEYLDPQNTFQPHCEDEHQSGRRPNQACIFCIRSHGLDPNAGATNRKVNTVTITTPPPSRTDGEVEDKCQAKCGNYEALCVPLWLDKKKTFSRHCKDQDDAGMPSQECIMCLKINGLPTTTTPATTTPTPSTVAATTPTTTAPVFISDPCRERCLDYEDICLPTYLDPFDLFKPHCEEVNNKGWPPLPCLKCLQTFPVTPKSKHSLSTTPASTVVHEKVTVTGPACEGSDCEVDPCVTVCGNYNSLCMPGHLDPADVFFPHCENTKNVGLPTSACIACVRQHGLTSTTSSARTTRKKIGHGMDSQQRMGDNSLDVTEPSIIRVAESVTNAGVAESVTVARMAEPVTNSGVVESVTVVREADLGTVAEGTNKNIQSHLEEMETAITNRDMNLPKVIEAIDGQLDDNGQKTRMDDDVVSEVRAGNKAMGVQNVMKLRDLLLLLRLKAMQREKKLRDMQQLMMLRNLEQLMRSLQQLMKLSNPPITQYKLQMMVRFDE